MMCTGCTMAVADEYPAAVYQHRGPDWVPGMIYVCMHACMIYLYMHMSVCLYVDSELPVSYMCVCVSHMCVCMHVCKSILS
jgi:hypothetical protein